VLVAVAVALLVGMRAWCCLQECLKEHRPLEAEAQSCRLEGSRLLPTQLLAAAPALAGLAAVAQDWGLAVHQTHHNPQVEVLTQLPVGRPAAAAAPGVGVVLAAQLLYRCLTQLRRSAQARAQLPALWEQQELGAQLLHCRLLQLPCSGQAPAQMLALWGQQEGAGCWAVLQLMHRS
jgi:hypothetical protein